MLIFGAAAVSLAALAAAVPAPVAPSAPISYTGHRVVRFSITTPEQASLLSSLVQDRTNGIKSWTDITVGANADLLVPPQDNFALSPVFGKIQGTVIVPDLQKRIDAQRAYSASHADVLSAALAAGKISAPSASDVFADYQDLSTLVAFISSLPGVKQISIGTTYEGRDIPGFVFGSGPKNIVFNGGIHAREWISPAVATYITNYLLSGSSDAVQLLQNFTFTVVPVLNPDGYAYTRDANGDRYWRKNRMPPPQGSSCYGVDPNRNFDAHWSGNGASSYSCADDYYGESAFSAAESLAISNYVKNLGNVVSHIDFHSYSQLWMFPYGWTCDQNIPEPDYTNAQQGSQIAVKALKAVNGVSFRNGPICSTVYQASGSSSDYMYSIGVKFPYAVELRDTGNYGFDLPPSKIVPSGQEVVAAVVALWKFVATKV